jgi:CheY-like chemotaxis protein
MNVLIVEDNPITLKLLEHTVDKYGYETHSAKDSDQALECFDALPEMQHWRNNLARIGNEPVSAPTERLPFGQSIIDSHPSLSPYDRALASFNSGPEHE